MSRYALLLLASMLTAMADTAPTADENLRIAALRAIFPNMQISLLSGKRIDDSWPEQPRPRELDSPDALAKENIYRVAGAATNEAEKEASAQLITGVPSSTRLVRFQVFPWPGRTGFLAVLQYRFEDALPSMSCPSIGLLVHLENASGKWKVLDRYLLETMHHYTLQTIRMLNLTGDGLDELAIESDFGGAETWGTNFMIFQLGAKMELIFETTSQIARKTDEMFTQVLNIPETLEQQGKEICFVKTTMIENGNLYTPARLSRACYFPDGESNRLESEARRKMLTP